MAADGRPLAGARVIVIGASYKAGVRDLRESPAVPIIEGLIREGAEVAYHDPLIPVLDLPGGPQLHSVAAPRGPAFDLAVVHTLHPGWTTPGPTTPRWSSTPPTSSPARPTARWCEDHAMITDLRAADWSTPAVVLKFDQNMLHHGSLGVIRSLGRLGVPVYGVHEGPGLPPRVPATCPAASSGSPSR